MWWQMVVRLLSVCTLCDHEWFSSRSISAYSRRYVLPNLAAYASARSDESIFQGCRPYTELNNSWYHFLFHDKEWTKENIKIQQERPRSRRATSLSIPTLAYFWTKERPQEAEDNRAEAPKAVKGPNNLLATSALARPDIPAQIDSLSETIMCILDDCMKVYHPGLRRFQTKKLTTSRGVRRLDARIEMNKTAWDWNVKLNSERLNCVYIQTLQLIEIQHLSRKQASRSATKTADHDISTSTFTKYPK